MRKKNRETIIERAYAIFDEAPYATIACIDIEGKPYSLPASIARVRNTLYFHCALEGKKYDSLMAHPDVCVSAVSKSDIMAERQSVAYASSILYGIAQWVGDPIEKKQALRAICEKFTPNHLQCIHSISEEGLQKTGIFKIIPHEITGKEIPFQ